MAIINGANLYYIDKGQGTPILFIHPPVLSSYCFIYQIEELSKEFRIIAFDIRGHGRSEPARQPLTYPLIVEDMKQLLDHLNIDKAYLCGYSTGGSIVLEFMLTYPERVSAGIVIGGLSEVSDWGLRSKISLGVAFAKFKAIRTLAMSISWSNSNKLGIFWRMYQDAKKSNPQNAAEYYRYSIKYNCTDRLHHIKQPVLLIYGKEDKGFHRYCKMINERLQNSEIKIIPNVKHQIPTKAAKTLNQLIKQYVNRA